MELHDWVECHQDKFLTIADVSHLKEGDKMEVLIFKYGFRSYNILPHLKDNVTYKPDIFFSAQKNTIEMEHDGMWSITNIHDQIYLSAMHVDAGNCGVFLKNKWLSLSGPKRDTLRIDLRMLNIVGQNDLRNFISKHISELSPDTLVGYTGPMMKWSDVMSSSDVYIDKKQHDCLTREYRPNGDSIHNLYSC